MSLGWIIRVSAAVAAVAAGVVFARWVEPDAMLGGLAPPSVVSDHDRARGLLREGKFDEGIEVVRGVLDREPRKATSWELLATLHERRDAPGDADKARDARRRAISLYERAMRRDAWPVSEHERWYRLGWLQRRVGDQAKAHECFERARAAHLRLAERARGDLSADFLYNMAALAALCGRTEDALDAWERANESGFARFERASRDPDLDTIRSEPRFAAAMEVGRARQREQQERLREQREQREREVAERQRRRETQ